MAMFLKLEASSPENTKIQSTPGIPDFMDWNQITSLPYFWRRSTASPSRSLRDPGAGVLRLHHRRGDVQARVGGTYFAIITRRSRPFSPS